ncbi:DUF5134 domain-containing protein [Mycobacteroides salmoniphilum]|uniref:DUF5134 domain-containing protein n=1 Tax=Mycobacteroides salmoniphilum TaxID=404941 RepID=UPI000994310B|nr:DUF5134 domain-containing protein [Mycobacteroides salmoniphilum]
MITDLALRWIVSALFVFSALECGAELVRGRHTATIAISNTLHVAMAVTMITMAWPLGMHLPNRSLMTFFSFAAVWFLAMMLTTALTYSERGVVGYHAVMMTAMAWMCGAMSGSFQPAQPANDQHTVSTSETMPGMDMSHDMPRTDTTSEWIGSVNWACFVGFSVAAMFWTYRYFAERKRAASSPYRAWGMACQAMMAVGMAIMFHSML